MAAKNILIVEDDPAMRKALALILRNEGYRVQESGDGEEAVGRLEEGGIDLIVSDLFLERSSGLDIFDKAEGRTPCLIITGYGESPLGLEAKRRAGDRYLEKPFSAQALKDKVTWLLASREADRATPGGKNKGGSR